MRALSRHADFDLNVGEMRVARGRRLWLLVSIRLLLLLPLLCLLLLCLVCLPVSLQLWVGLCTIAKEGPFTTRFLRGDQRNHVSTRGNQIEERQHLILRKRRKKERERQREKEKAHRAEQEVSTQILNTRADSQRGNAQRAPSTQRTSCKSARSLNQLPMGTAFSG